MLSATFIVICASIVMPKRDRLPKMENYPIGFVGYIVGFIMGHLLNKFESKELRVYKQRIKQLEEEQKQAAKIQEEKKKDTQRFVELLKHDNDVLRKQLAEKNNAIQRLEDYLSHILAYASEIRQKTLQQRTILTYAISQNFFDVYQDILEALSDIRYGTNSEKTLKRRDSRKSLTDKNSYKKMYYEEKCSKERLNSQMEQTQADLARIRKQTENLKQEKINLQKRALQDSSLNDIRSFDNFERLAEQYKTLLASYYFLETQFINLKNGHDIAVNYNQDLQITLQAKNAYIHNIQKVLISFLSLRYLFQDFIDVNSTYDHGNFVLHIAEQEDSTERSKYFQNFVGNIKKGVVRAKEANDQEGDSNSLMLKLSALQNKYENSQCLRENAESKCAALEQELKTKELTEANFLDEYNKICVMHTNVSAEVKQKTRELENLNKDFQAFKAQAQENEEDLKKGLDQIKQSYHIIHEENISLKSGNEAAQNSLHDLLMEKDDLLYKYNCLEEELICAQNQLNQYKNPDLMPSYQEVLKLYTEVKKIVEDAEHREKECAERNGALTGYINKLTAENRQLKSKPNFQKISSLYEAINVQSLQKNEYTSMKEFYRKEIRRLNLENVKLLTALRNEQNGPEHREFKSKFEAAKTKIRVLEESFDNAKFEQIVFNFEENLNKIVAETFEIIGEISPEKSQLTQKYDELIDMLRQEHERLEVCVNNKTEDLEEASGHRLPIMHEHEQKEEEEENDAISYVGSYVSSALKKIEKIRRDIGELEARVDRFRGSRKDKEYLDLDHKLLENIMRIDVIQVEGHEIIREKRKETVIYANDCMLKLEDNVME